MSEDEQVRECEFCHKPYIFEPYAYDKKNNFTNCCPNCARDARENTKLRKSSAAEKERE